MKRSDRGFGLVEAGVVAIVFVVVGVAAVPSLLGSRVDSREQTVREVARQYEDAIESYRDDNGGAAPIIGQPSWPRDSIEAGPLDSAAASDQSPGGVPYMTQGAPAAVTNGTVSINVGKTGQNGEYARVEYHAGSGPSKPYLLRVRTREGKTWSTLCTLGPAGERGTRC